MRQQEWVEWNRPAPKVCDCCGKRAIYRQGALGYCKDHLDVVKRELARTYKHSPLARLEQRIWD